jgi:hypothetical protein
LLAATGLLLAAYLALGGWHGAGAPPRAVPSRPARHAAPPQAAEPPLPTRNPFRFAEEAAPRPLAPAATPATPGPSAAPQRPPVRLVGFVRRGEDVVAALSINGEVVLAGRGDSVGGFSVLSIDDDVGVRLRATDGSELALAVEPDPSS